MVHWSVGSWKDNFVKQGCKNIKKKKICNKKKIDGDLFRKKTKIKKF